jgi:hypothetical protein
MKEQKVILGEFENEFYAEIAIRDLQAEGISANILIEDSHLYLIFLDKDKAVQLVIPDTQIEKAKKVLEKKFY